MLVHSARLSEGHIRSMYLSLCVQKGNESVDMRGGSCTDAITGLVLRRTEAN
jgi:hypothetical protein